MKRCTVITTLEPPALSTALQTIVFVTTMPLPNDTDVLNQRYLVKRDPKTGITRRLLRLAIGSRSQLVATIISRSCDSRRTHALAAAQSFEKQLLTGACAYASSASVTF